jgi:hypothetical protein
MVSQVNQTAAIRELPSVWELASTRMGKASDGYSICRSLMACTRLAAAVAGKPSVQITPYSYCRDADESLASVST